MVAECVHVVSYASKLAYVASVSQLDSLGYCDDNRGFFLQEIFYLGKEFLDVKRNLRQINQIRGPSQSSDLERAVAPVSQPAFLPMISMMVIMFFL